MVRSTFVRLGLIVAATAVTASGWALAQGSGGTGRIAKHEESGVVERCANYAVGDPRRAAQSTRDGCDPQCLQCHTAEATSHHPVGSDVPSLPSPALQRTSTGKIACTTCHNLASATTDSVAWRAQSMYDAIFRKRARYSTYLLTMRNQRGQLCQSCH